MATWSPFSAMSSSDRTRRVGGDVTAVGGGVIRDPAATVGGNVQSIGGFTSGFDRLRPWIDHCLFYGRPLALVPGIGWAWALAFIFLALYVFLALLFRDAVTRCAVTVETQPGMAFVAALLSILLIPIAMVLLCITVIGIAAIPFVLFGAFCVGLFGKAVMLAWIGRRVRPRRRPAGSSGRRSDRRRTDRARALSRSRRSASSSTRSSVCSDSVR